MEDRVDPRETAYHSLELIVRIAGQLLNQGTPVEEIVVAQITQGMIEAREIVEGESAQILKAKMNAAIKQRDAWAKQVKYLDQLIVAELVGEGHEQRPPPSLRALDRRAASSEKTKKSRVSLQR
jgi:hypothetical protein